MEIKDFKKTVNFRDLGGYTSRDGQVIASGLYYRSGALNLLDPQELDAVNSLHIQTVLDLRSKGESDVNPDPPIKGAQHFQHSGVDINGKGIDFSPAGMSQIGADGNRQYEMLKRYYQLMPYHNKAFQIFFRQIREKQLPILFHCFTGKDRTGVAAMLLLALLNVDRETILNDYNLSNQYFQKRIDEMMANTDIDLDRHPETRRLLQMCYGVLPEIGELVYDGVLERYGSFETYFLEEYGFTPDDIEAIRSFSYK